MKTILTNKQKNDFLYENWRLTTLCFKWGKSGMHPVTIHNKRNESTKFKAGGCGYDKKGTALGQLINHHFKNELSKLNSDDFYGLTHYKENSKKRFLKKGSKFTKSYVDGACGFNCMEKILNKIGFKLNFVMESDWQTIYTMQPNKRIK